MMDIMKQKEIDYTNSYLMSIVAKDYTKAMRIKVMIQESQLAIEKMEILEDLQLEDLKIDIDIQGNEE